MRPLSFRQRVFIDHYLGESSGNATDAARRSGYLAPRQEGSRLLRNPAIRAAVNAHVAEGATTANEILARLADIASWDPLAFIDLDQTTGKASFDLKLIKELGLGHVIRRMRSRDDGTWELEFEPRLPALIKVGEFFRLWDKEANSQLTLVDLAKNLKERYEELRAKGDDDEPADPVEKPADPAQ